MGRDGVRNTVSCNILIKSLFQNGKVDETLSVWTILGKDDTCCPDSLTMVLGLRENGFIAKASQVLKESQENGENNFDVFAYSSMINDLCKNGRLDEAMKIMNRWLDLVARQILIFLIH
nr:pentatricopeptide repeat protein AaPPR722 [Agave angustifolia]